MGLKMNDDEDITFLTHFVAWMLYAAFVVLILFTSSYVFAKDKEIAECDEWANFTKIITYKFRDNGFNETDVKVELTRAMNENAELPTAINWISFSYAHPELTDRQIWDSVYDKCKMQF